MIPVAAATLPCPLLAGVDTFLVNFKLTGEDEQPNGATLPESVIATLDAWQANARKEHDLSATDLTFSYTLADETYEQTFLIRPHGYGVWSWLLTCGEDDVRLALSHGGLNGAVFAQARFSSHLLWTLGPGSLALPSGRLHALPASLGNSSLRGHER